MKVRKTRVYEVIFPEVSRQWSFAVHKVGCADIADTLKWCGGSAAPMDLDLSDPEWSMAQIDGDKLGYEWDSVKVYRCAQRDTATGDGLFELRGKRYKITAKDEHGTQVVAGDHVERKGEDYQVKALTRGPEYNGTAKVRVEITRCDEMPGRVGWEHDFYDHALGLTVSLVDEKVSSGNDLHDMSTEHRSGECACPSVER